MGLVDLLNCTCTVQQRRYGAPDEHGQPTETWGEVKNIPCRMSMPYTYKFVEFFGLQSGAEIFRIFYLPQNIEIAPKDRIADVTHKNGTLIDAGPFDVINVNAHFGYYGLHHLRILARRIKEGGL